MQDDNIQTPLSEPVSPPDLPPNSPDNKNYKKLFFGLATLAAIALVAGGIFYWHKHHTDKAVVAMSNPSSQTSSVPTKTNQARSAAKLPGLQLASNKNYGNRYADGIVPVGDGKYVTSAPKAGYIYACANYARNIQVESGGAGKRGPWFTDSNTKYDINKKIHVEGHVMWQAEFSNKISGDKRVIVTNDLPDHPTGIFPISSSDPASVYDRNPNSIKGQTMTYELSLNPTYNTTPTCESGQVGVMLTGVALFNGFDAGGRDAGAWEIQDNCDGHPQSDGIYHYHTLSSCIKNVSVKSVIGYALDGFPITGPQIRPNNILTTSDLDACHGITSQISLNGKTVTMYHYVMTQDFPYSVSCFRGTPIEPPGQKPAGGPAQNHP